MEKVGLDVLREQGGEVESAITGFHWPIHTVRHLHTSLYQSWALAVFHSFSPMKNGMFIIFYKVMLTWRKIF